MKTINSFTDDYSFLSNFAPSKIYLGNREYATVEHFYQAGKADNESDHNIVRTASGPGAAKRAGRNITKRKDWEKIKMDYMRLGLRLKFDTKEFGDMLLETGNAKLEEGNDWGDTFWGTVDGKGKNKLGKILMEIRGEVLERRSKQVTTTTEEEVELGELTAN